jgi:aryl-alcohol dehydrogenase-like predicted oxidoreductase
MTDLPKRELGRTGLQVTMLGYGAMELRGAPRGRDVTEAQAETSAADPPRRPVVGRV